jgi:hypothetical protein
VFEKKSSSTVGLNSNADAGMIAVLEWKSWGIIDVCDVSFGLRAV